MFFCFKYCALFFFLTVSVFSQNLETVNESRESYKKRRNETVLNIAKSIAELDDGKELSIDDFEMFQDDVISIVESEIDLIPESNKRRSGKKIILLRNKKLGRFLDILKSKLKKAIYKVKRDTKTEKAKGNNKTKKFDEARFYLKTQFPKKYKSLIQTNYIPPLALDGFIKEVSDQIDFMIKSKRKAQQSAFKRVTTSFTPYLLNEKFFHLFVLERLMENQQNCQGGLDVDYNGYDNAYGSSYQSNQDCKKGRKILGNIESKLKKLWEKIDNAEGVLGKVFHKTKKSLEPFISIRNRPRFLKKASNILSLGKRRRHKKLYDKPKTYNVEKMYKNPKKALMKILKKAVFDKKLRKEIDAILIEDLAINNKTVENKEEERKGREWQNLLNYKQEQGEECEGLSGTFSDIDTDEENQGVCQLILKKAEKSSSFTSVGGRYEDLLLKDARNRSDSSRKDNKISGGLDSLIDKFGGKHKGTLKKKKDQYLGKLLESNTAQKITENKTVKHLTKKFGIDLGSLFG